MEKLEFKELLFPKAQFNITSILFASIKYIIPLRDSLVPLNTACIYLTQKKQIEPLVLGRKKRSLFAKTLVPVF